jgi:hypothetical protein
MTGFDAAIKKPPDGGDVVKELSLVNRKIRVSFALL